MAYNHKTGLVYIPAIELGEVFGMPVTPFSYRKQQGNRGVIHFEPSILALEEPRLKAVIKHWPSTEAVLAGQSYSKPRTFLRAWDPRRQRSVWEVETTDNSGLGSIPNLDGAGVMTTAGGLVFQGRSAGDFNGRLVIYDAEKGMQLHSIDIGAGIHAAPMSYAIAGEQYVALMVGARNDSRIIALKLSGIAIPKRVETYETNTKPSAPSVSPFGTSTQIELGQQVFERTCAVCHVNAARAPDLTKMDKRTHEQFLDIVLRGQRADKGMGNYSGILTEEEAEAVHAYITQLAWDKYRKSTTAGS